MGEPTDKPGSAIPLNENGLAMFDKEMGQKTFQSPFKSMNSLEKEADSPTKADIVSLGSGKSPRSPSVLEKNKDSIFSVNNIVGSDQELPVVIDEEIREVPITEKMKEAAGTKIGRNKKQVWDIRD